MGVAVSSLVATGRVIGGKHFPTDVITGAVVGSSVGFLIPYLHERPDLPIAPVVGQGTAGVLWRWM